MLWVLFYKSHQTIDHTLKKKSNACIIYLVSFICFCSKSNSCSVLGKNFNKKYFANFAILNIVSPDMNESLPPHHKLHISQNETHKKNIVEVEE